MDLDEPLKLDTDLSLENFDMASCKLNNTHLDKKDLKMV